MTDKEKLDAIRAEIHRLVEVRGYDREMANDLFAFMDLFPNESASKVWHDVTEKPNTKRFVVLTKDGMITTAFIPLKMSFDELAERSRIKKWAYLDNLVNLSNVERTVKDWKEMPISEDLGEYINELSKQFPEVSFAKLSRIAVRVAKWQKQQDQSTIELAEDHAMLAGMEKMKEEMMAKAVDATVHIEAGNYPYIPQIELYDYDKDEPLAKEGDKYKVVLIKEE